MNGFLLDTHIWLWHALGDDRLPQGLRRLVERTPPDRRWLSPISIWELGLLVERGRLELAEPLRPWVADALRNAPMREATLTTDVAVRSHEIALAERDPGDRLIAATASVYDLTLITVDPNLTREKWLTTRSR